MRKKEIAVDIQNEVQYFSLAPLLPELVKRYNVSIISGNLCPGDSAYEQIIKGTEYVLEKNNIQYKRLPEVKDLYFDLCLCPYITNRIKAKHYLKYEYGTLNIKPSLTYTPACLSGFHGFLCQSSITKVLLSAYAMTFPVDNLRLFNLSRKPEKNTILFAPTYNDDDSIKDIHILISQLKTAGFRVIIKGHHGTEHLKQNKQKRDLLFELADEYYGSETSLSSLLVRAEACLFGNSSAIGEALYAGVPCAIFAHNLDSFALGDIHTSQYHFSKDKIIPFCNKPSMVAQAVKECLSSTTQNKQKLLASQLFDASFRTGTKGYLDAIAVFLQDTTGIIDEYSSLLHIAKQKELNESRKENQVLRQNLEKTKEELLGCQHIINDYNNGKLYRLARKLYDLEGKIINGKS